MNLDPRPRPRSPRLERLPGHKVLASLLPVDIDPRGRARRRVNPFATKGGAAVT